VLSLCIFSMKGTLVLLKTTFFSDFRLALFSPRVFFANRFLLLDRRRIHAFGFIGVFLGLSIGSLINYGVSVLVSSDFLARPELYQSAISSLGLKPEGFVELLSLQRSYAVVMGALSPLIAYMAHHVFGGALFAFLWLLARKPEVKLDFFRVLECASMALASMIFYAVPIIGPLLALTMVTINVSRALLVQYKMVGFMKAMSILSAIYICFFLSAATLQMLAEHLATRLKL
jgi:hypothetical protein